MELSNMVVFVGECGDTYYERVLGEVHKTVILKGVCCSALNQLHTSRSYPLEDRLPPKGQSTDSKIGNLEIDLENDKSCQTTIRNRFSSMTTKSSSNM